MILVVGSLPVDSGKTTLARALVTEARSRGIDIGVSKPVTAVSGWYRYPVIERSREMGVLVGNDASLLHQAAGSSDPVELESPLISLLMPPDPDGLEWRYGTYSAINPMGKTVAIRLSDIQRTSHWHLPDNIGRLPRALQEEVVSLIASLRPPSEAVDRGGAEEILSGSRESIESAVRWITQRHELTVVESYSNAACPALACLGAWAVVVVAPGKAGLIDGSRYVKAFELRAGLSGHWQITTDNLLGLVTPEESLELLPGDGGCERAAEEVIDRWCERDR